MRMKSHGAADTRTKENEKVPLFQMHHYLYLNGKYTNIEPEKMESFDCGLEVRLQPYQRDEDTLVMKAHFYNLSESSMNIKLFVENRIYGMDHRYGFISPKRDVLFFTDENSLCIASGVFREKSLCQYGIIERKRRWSWIRKAQIPFSPFGLGEVSGIYTLEKVLAPKEMASAYTWMIYSDSMAEQELLLQDQQLKTALAFL